MEITQNKPSGIRLKIGALHVLSREFFKYFLVSAIALALDYFLLTFLVQFGGLHYSVAAVIGFLAGTVLAFLLSVFWVFRRRSFETWSAGFISFSIIGVAGLLLNLAVLTFCVERLSLDYRLAKIIAAGLSFPFNFLVRRAIVFSARKISRSIK